MIMNILEQIGEPAALEQLAEECTELAHAALKLARKKRGENPTPKGECECVSDLLEEVADVFTCIRILSEFGWYDPEKIHTYGKLKEERWIRRLEGDMK